MNKKGFTLIELLAVLALLALITIVTVPIINTRKASINQKEYEALVINIKAAAKIHVSNNPELLNDKIDTCINVALSDLQSEKLLEPEIIDPRSNTEIPNTSIVEVCVVEENITYEFPVE